MIYMFNTCHFGPTLNHRRDLLRELNRYDVHKLVEDRELMAGGVPI